MTENHALLYGLKIDNVYCPDWISWSIAKLDQVEHARHKLWHLISFLALTCCHRVLWPDIRLLLQFTGNLQIRWVLVVENLLEGHRQPVSREDLTVLGNPDQKNASPLFSVDSVNRVFYQVPQLNEALPLKDLAP